MTYKAALFTFIVSVLAAGLLSAGPVMAQIMAQTGTQTAAPDNDTPDQATVTKRNLMLFAANNAVFDAKIEGEARTLFRRQFPECPTIDQAVRQIPQAYGLLSFPNNQGNSYPAPRSGLWVEHVKLRACGKIWQVNMLAVGRQDIPTPLLLALLPGETKADPAAQRNAQRIGATAIRKADSSCADEPRTTYTRMMGYKQTEAATDLGKDDKGLGWFEEWTYKFCQKDVPVQMAFTPDTSGGYDIKARLAAAAAPAAPQAKPAESKPASQ